MPYDVKHLVITGSGIDVLSVLNQNITWTKADLIPINPLGTNFEKL